MSGQVGPGVAVVAPPSIGDLGDGSPCGERAHGDPPRAADASESGDQRGSAPRRGVADYRARLGEAIVAAPSFTLRGGTPEILRGIIARELGLR